MITIKNLCKKVSYVEIDRALNYHYPEDKNSYLSVYNFILTCNEIVPSYYYEDEKIKQIAPKLIITCVNDYIETDGKNFQDNSYYYSIGTEEHGISFVAWEELVNLEIAEDTLNHYRPAEIIAHFIWEITFYGNEEETQKIKSDIMEKLEEVKTKENYVKF